MLPTNHKNFFVEKKKIDTFLDTSELTHIQTTSFFNFFTQTAISIFPYYSRPLQCEAISDIIPHIIIPEWQTYASYLQKFKKNQFRFTSIFTDNALQVPQNFKQWFLTKKKKQYLVFFKTVNALMTHGKKEKYALNFFQALTSNILHTLPEITSFFKKHNLYYKSSYLLMTQNTTQIPSYNALNWQENFYGNNFFFSFVKTIYIPDFDKLNHSEYLNDFWRYSIFASTHHQNLSPQAREYFMLNPEKHLIHEFPWMENVELKENPTLSLKDVPLIEQVSPRQVLIKKKIKNFFDLTKALHQYEIESDIADAIVKNPVFSKKPTLPLISSLYIYFLRLIKNYFFIFNFFVYKIDKKIKKFLQKGQPKFKIVWKYILPYKRMANFLNLFRKNVKFMTPLTLFAKLQTLLKELILTNSQNFILQSNLFAHNYVLKNFKKSLLQSFNELSKN